MKLHIETATAGNRILIDSDTGNTIAIVADIAAVEKLVAEHAADEVRRRKRRGSKIDSGLQSCPPSTR